MSPDRLAAFDALTPNGPALVAALRYESQVAGIADTGQYVGWLERHVLAARDDAAQLRETLYAVQTEAQKDRERLDWLEQSNVDSEEASRIINEFRWRRTYWGSLRAAIDAARRG